ncbi:hypothetical protein FHU23_000759 [Clostridium saccharobutylicum]|uniref:Uncharacterized protein n=2 Tax=Clostridium saccharobutylicum TaxID=169679 RepID=U5MPG4_CLOSA|nr:HTH domain-containing protein [Clostridium saccharobutylicum]AGX41571.1 hypothetical protein CLSA_c05550 [Clostridium saccharobutylicum DSM 13864]MBA2904150.1 hypothetical protein [Clostridium saccharobutylicum]MBA8895418.1 hypothetical protein [Clostridium saccharobutylicum]MBA8982311.1 hypothetical protein [Clostridium saccharobutylicum]MBC2438902.1 hypothetical protein [Clostridium saccharobutylicum]
MLKLYVIRKDKIMDKFETIKNNISENEPTRNNLLKAVTNFKLSTKALQKITGLDPEWLNSYLNKRASVHDLSYQSMAELSNLSFMLSDAITFVDNDDRIKGIIDILKEEFYISYETIALYAKIDVIDVEKFIEDTKSIGFEKKYKIATISSLLLYLSKK